MLLKLEELLEIGTHLEHIDARNRVNNPWVFKTAQDPIFKTSVDRFMTNYMWLNPVLSSQRQFCRKRFVSASFDGLRVLTVTSIRGMTIK